MPAIKLVANKPEIIALQFTGGKKVNSNFGGDQVMFTLVDGQQLYVSPYVAAKIEQLNVGKGEPFVIEKKETIDGQRRTVSFEVAPLQVAQPVNPVPARNSVATTVPSVISNQVVNQPAQQSTATPTPAADSNLELSLRYAIDAAASAEAYAKAKNYSVRFTSEDIRAMALSKFIAMDRNGGGKWNN